MRRGRAFLPVAAVTAALAIAGCGSDDHPNEDRPPDPIELTAKATDQEMTISPDKVGAGLAVITISNISEQTIKPSLSGPTEAAALTIEPGDVGELKTNLEQGTYTFAANGTSEAEGDTLVVGPERPSSQNELLLP